jgi:hypothetical protein
MEERESKYICEETVWQLEPAIHLSITASLTDYREHEEPNVKYGPADSEREDLRKNSDPSKTGRPITTPLGSGVSTETRIIGTCTTCRVSGMYVKFRDRLLVDFRPLRYQHVPLTRSNLALPRREEYSRQTVRLCDLVKCRSLRAVVMHYILELNAGNQVASSFQPPIQRLSGIVGQ